MATIEITLDANYCHRWGLWEGVREIIQNGIDGEREFGYKLDVRRTTRGTLIVENKGGYIPREAMLIGYSTKRDNVDLSGQFGEGLKLGMLALVRAGYPVLIQNGDETWKPVIEHSDKFNADVLKFKVTKGKDCNCLRVKVKGISDAKWKEMKKLFLFLTPPKQSIKTYDGTLLMDKDLIGQIFVKGIFVDRDPDFTYGYDLPTAEIDRDRRMVDRWDLRYRTSKIVNAALNQKPEMFKDVYDLLVSNKEEVGYLGNLITDESTAKLAEAFNEEHGEDAVPVQNLSESKEIDHLGKKGIVVPEGLNKVLEKKYGNFLGMKQELAKSAFTLCSFADLSQEEKDNLELAIDMIHMVDDRISLDTIDVVEYADEGMLGQHVDGRTRLAKKVLTTPESALEVLAHEWCHGAGGDGEKAFTDAVQRLLARVAIACLNK